MVRAGRLWARRPIVAMVFVMVVVAVAVGVVGQRARAGQGRPSAGSARTAATEICDATRIKGTSLNKTGIPMKVTQFQYGDIPHQWCRVPEDEVRAHSSDPWHIAGRFPPLSIGIVYRLENGDEIFFWAGLIKPEGTRAGCGFVKVVRTPRQYECQAEVGIAGPDFAYVAFTVQPGPAGSTRDGGMRNGARPQELIDLGDGRLLAVGHQEGRGSGAAWRAQETGRLCGRCRPVGSSASSTSLTVPRHSEQQG